MLQPPGVVMDRARPCVSGYIGRVERLSCIPIEVGILGMDPLQFTLAPGDSI